MSDTDMVESSAGGERSGERRLIDSEPSLGADSDNDLTEQFDDASSVIEGPGDEKSRRHDGRMKSPLTDEPCVESGGTTSSDSRTLKRPKIRFIPTDITDFNELRKPTGRCIAIPKKPKLAIQYIIHLAESGLDYTEEFFEWHDNVAKKKKNAV